MSGFKACSDLFYSIAFNTNKTTFLFCQFSPQMKVLYLIYVTVALGSPGGLVVAGNQLSTLQDMPEAIKSNWEALCKMNESLHAVKETRIFGKCHSGKLLFGIFRGHPLNPDEIFVNKGLMIL